MNCSNHQFDSYVGEGRDLLIEKSKQERNSTKEADVLLETHGKRNGEEMIMTTCPSVEGCRIKRQCGLVFGERVFKIWKCQTYCVLHETEFDNNYDTELLGSSRDILSAREYAIQMMKQQAENRNANAILGVQINTALGEDIFHICVFGTAVEIEAISPA